MHGINRYQFLKLSPMQINIPMQLVVIMFPKNSIMSYSNSIAQIVTENNVCIYLTQRICCYVKEHSC